ncbi:hypothetical protein K7432_006167 [Basidiobolus ranarum]|uniref:Uncharacterized protein n=1 Tax=Basidiobolus ranarum TaxID=34480 RepID=A0ABR2WVL1_9FUNG
MYRGFLLLALSLFGCVSGQINCPEPQFAPGLQIDLSECISPKSNTILPATQKFTVSWDFEATSKCTAIWKNITGYADLQQLSFGYQGCKVSVFNALTEPFKTSKGSLTSLEEACRGCSASTTKFALYLAGSFGGNKVLFMGFTNVKLTYLNLPGATPTSNTGVNVGGSGSNSGIGAGNSIGGGSPTHSAPSVFGTAKSEGGVSQDFTYQFTLLFSLVSLLIHHNYC